MRYAYPVTLASDADGRVIASFPDVPEALTDGADETQALAEAADALAAALAGYARERRPLPRPSAARGRHIVPVPPLAAAKLALCEAMRRQERSATPSSRSLSRRSGAAAPRASADRDAADRGASSRGRTARRAW